MHRGTTPTFTFTLPFLVEQITALNVCFSQNNKVVLEKSLHDCELKQNTIKVTLTENETLRFDSESGIVEIQLRIGVEETRLVSNIMFVSVERILKDGVLE